MTLMNHLRYVSTVTPKCYQSLRMAVGTQCLRALFVWFVLAVDVEGNTDGSFFYCGPAHAHTDPKTQSTTLSKLSTAFHDDTKQAK